MPIPPFGSPPTPDATSTKKGKIKLTNELGGTADLPTLGVLTTKGDLLTRTSSANARQVVGTNDYVLTADSAQTNGIKWAAAGAASFIKNEVPAGSVNSSNTAFTTASNFITGSLRVYQNGIRLKAGGVDFTEGTAPAFTFVTAPTTGDTLLVDYDISSGTFATGSASWTSNETPSGTVNGSNVTFTLVAAPVTGTLQLFRDGQLMKGGGEDYSLSSATITFTTAPATSSVLLAFYQSAVSSAGNADLLDGFDSSYFWQLAEGEMINGKITPTVTSNNLTLTLQTLDGSTPSATNPVKVRIGGVIRSIIAALSVTKNAGTNYGNAGSTQLATKENDWFAYLGYNATDGVVIGFSRFPGSHKYADFSTTATTWNYAAISTITNAASTDSYVVIGRFAATLSATASFNWSVPTYDAANLIQYPIRFTRTLTIAPTLVWAGGAAPTSPTGTNYTYKLDYRTCFFWYFSSFTAGTAITSVTATIPVGTATQYSAMGHVSTSATVNYTTWGYILTNDVVITCASNASTIFGCTASYPIA